MSEIDNPGKGIETVALVGAPNVGKSVVFNYLADEYVDVSNYPGTTVETTLARMGEYAITDTPGAYGIASFDEEERITREIVLEADRVINVVDVTHLDRDLFLTLQLLDMGVPTVVCLNMMDEAEAAGIDVDPDALEAALGVPVVPTVAVSGKGLDEIPERLAEADAPAEPAIADYFDEIPEDLEVDRRERTLLAEADETTAREVAERAPSIADGGTPSYVDPDRRDAIYSDRRDRVGGIVDRVVSEIERGRTWADRASDLMLNPLTGTPIALGLLGVIFYVIGVFVAQTFVGFTEGVLFGEYYNPFMSELVAGLMPAAGWAEPIEFLLINDNLGLLTITLQYMVGVLLPLIVAFYIVIGALEDSGVLPRLAVLTDRGLSRMGLNGRAIVPMIVGVGCVTMAVITTRMVGSRRERLIATGLLGLAIPCSAQLGVIMGLLAGLGLAWWFGYLAVLLVVLGLVGLSLDRVLPGESEGLVTELPRMRVPRPTNIVRKTSNRTKMFFREAGPLFGATAIVVSLADYTGLLTSLKQLLVPVTAFIGMPADFAQVLILGLIRRDFAAAGMTDMALSAPQIFVGLVVITFFVPCILAMVMIGKERDLKSGLATWFGSWLVAFAVGGLLAVVFGL
ncbi:MAG: ferrous iron transport protein B [Halodesulfurarchaeum sp.]|nr:ferrous iron transport protein B [Halodesulfurarchaeum sp.]